MKIYGYVRVSSIDQWRILTKERRIDIAVIDKSFCEFFVNFNGFL